MSTACGSGTSRSKRATASARAQPAILPHGGNLFQDKVPAAVVVANGFGKLMGSTQVDELGEIESPIVLTNTLGVPRAAEAIVNWVLAYPGNETRRLGERGGGRNQR